MISVVLCTSINLDTDLLTQVYPNPTNGNFTIKTNILIEGKIMITNNLGQIIKEKNINSRKTNFDISDDPSRGLYFIKIYNETNQLIKISKILLH